MRDFVALASGKTGASECLAEQICSVTGARWVRQGVLAMLWMALVLMGSAAAFGQAQNTGSIYGSVVDPSGAVIVGAQVVASEPSRGVTRQVVTTKAGEYILPALPVGSYTLTVTAPGFQTFVAESVTVDADNAVKLQAQLTVGDKGETVQVEAEGLTLDTRSAQIGALIDNKMVEDLPIDGRNVVALASLLPGVTALNAPTTNTNDKSGSTYSVSGARSTQNLQLFDGLMWNNLFLNTGIQYPPPNGLQEISVLLNNFKAQYGRNAGSIFNVITKQGSNAIHGSAWEYLQNQMFNAHDYLTQKNPEDNSHQFGFTVGGPVLRDKLFYQVTFQGTVQHLQNVASAPTQSYAERGLQSNGQPLPCTLHIYSTSTCASFRELLIPASANCTPGVNCKANKFYNPAVFASSSGLQANPSDALPMFQSAYVQAGGNPNQTAPCINDLNTAANYAASHPYMAGYDNSTQPQYIPNGEIPSSCLNPVIQNLLNKYAPPPNTISANGVPVYVSAMPLPRHEKNFTVRGDWIASAHHTVDARYNMLIPDQMYSYGVNSAGLGIATFDPSFDHAISHFGNIGDTWVLNPNMVNVLRLGYKRYVYTNPPSDNSTWNTLGGNFTEPTATNSPTLPVITASNQYNLGSIAQSNSTVTNENIELLEQFTYTRGKHTFQAGVNWLRLQYLNRTDYPGTIAFSSTFTGYSFADEAMGLATSVRANSPLVQGGIQNEIFTYLQDDWRVTPRLTVNLGVRYELPFQWHQPNGYASTFIAGHQSTRFPGAIGGLAFPGDPGVLNSLVPTDFNGIVPRVGAVYDVFGTGVLALRAGFGMFFDAVNANVIGVGEPFYYQFFKNLPPGGASVPLATYGQNGSVLQVPNGYDKSNPTFVAPYSLFYPDRNFRTPYYEAGNVGFEYKVTHGGVLDVNYVVKLGRKQTIAVDQNPAIYDCTGGYFQANPQLYCYGASTQTASIQQRLRYTPFNYGGNGLVDYESAATSNYNALQAMYVQRGGKLLTLHIAYTYSKAIDLQSGATQLPGPQNVIPNVFNIATERGLSDNNAKHVLNLGWVLTVPRSHSGFRLVDNALGNWNFGGTFNGHTGRPFNLTENSTSVYSEPNARPALVAGANPNLPSNRHRVDKIREWFNIDAFTYPATDLHNSVPRNFLIGPGYLLTNMDLQRYFSMAKLREGMRLGFRVDVFNVFNTPNLQNPRAQFSCTSTSLGGGPCNSTNTVTPTATYGNNTFGVVQSTYGTNGNTTTNGRKMQFSGSIYF